VRRHGDPLQGFFAVLDESTASMDTTSETCVYRACCRRQIGLLSVAHRPTVIQFHSKVLHFEFDEHHELAHRVRDAREMAQETAALLTRHLSEEIAESPLPPSHDGGGPGPEFYWPAQAPASW